MIIPGDAVEVYDNIRKGNNMLFVLNLFTPIRFVREIHFFMLWY